MSHPLEHLVIVFERSRPDPSGEHDDVRLGELLEGGIDGDPEHAVVTSDLTPLVTDESDLDRGDALEHLVGPDAVEGGEAGEERDGDRQGVAHAGVLSSATTRKRRR